MVAKTSSSIQSFTPEVQKLNTKKTDSNFQSEITRLVDSAKTKAEKQSMLTEVLDLFLQGKRSNAEEQKFVLEQLKNLNGSRGQANTVLAQINPRPGDIKANALKALRYIRAAEASNADSIVFPELTLVGYPIHDTIDRHPKLVEENIKWLQELAKLSGKTRVVIGFVEPRADKKLGKAYYNSVAVLAEGKVEGIIRKSLLPTYGEFNDSRYMEASPIAGNQDPRTLGKFSRDLVNPDADPLNHIHGKKYGIAICEDGWNDNDFFSQVLYDRNPVSKLAEKKPDIFINSSASPSRTKKEQLKHNMLGFVAKKHKVPMIYVNQVGAIDDVSFDGASRAYSADGKLIARAKSFEEQFLMVNPLEESGKIYPLAKGLEKTLHSNKEFSLNYEPDLDRTYKTVVQGIKDYCDKTGFKRAVLGLSGGLDSTISAVLLADALGPENVYGISMPSKITSDDSRNDARDLAKNLGIHFTEVPISKINSATKTELEKVFKAISKHWEPRQGETTTLENTQARARATLLWSIGNEFKSTLPIATSDKSELYLGYATINGDMSGGFAPIADITKTKLFALGRWMNKNRPQKNAIPEVILEKPPGAELKIDPKTGKAMTAEDDNMPYPFLDEIIWRLENLHQSYDEILSSKFLYEKDKPISQEQKQEWLDKFYQKMSRALFKWSLLPPSVILDAHTINKNEYRQPITSGNIDYKGKSPSEIASLLSLAV